MVVEKTFVIFLLAITLDNLLISIHGGCVQREYVGEAPTNGVYGDTFRKSQSHEYRFGRFKGPQRIVEHPVPNVPDLRNRNNFGDFLEMCGRNQVMIEGRCENITF